MVIAVVDDDHNFLEKIVSVLRTILNQEDILIPFTSSIRFFHHLENGHKQFDLILLDIRMPVMDGIEVGTAIRQYAPETAIVYLTKYTEYALAAIKLRPLDYLIKTNYQERLCEIIEQTRYHCSNQEQLIVRFYSTAVSLPLGGIRYIESQGRKLIVYYGTKQYPMYYKIADAEIELKSKGFVRAHRAYLVNTLHIVAVDRTRCILRVSGGQIIPVSPSKIAVLFEEFCQRRMGPL